MALVRVKIAPELLDELESKAHAALLACSYVTLSPPEVIVLVAEYREAQLAMDHLREFNHVEGESLDEVAAVAAQAYAFAQHRAESLAAQVKSRRRGILGRWL